MESSGDSVTTTATSPATGADPFATSPAPTAPSAASGPAADPFAAGDPFAAAPAIAAAGMSGQDWAIALGVLAAAAVLWFFVRGAVQGALAKQHAAPDAAIGAGWTLFALLMVVTATIVFGVIGDLWSVQLFLWPALGLSLLLLVLTGVMFTTALGRRR